MNESNAENLDTAIAVDTDELLSMLLGKMDKLDKLDGIETKISNFQVALTNVTDKIAEFTDNLQILDTIPVLTQRIDVATEEINKLKSDFNSLHQLVDSKLLSTDFADGVVAISDKIQHLEVINDSLSSRLSELAETR